MPRRLSPAHRALTAARWPLGIGLTSFAYVWRTVPVHRRELEGTWPADAPPMIPEGVDTTEFQHQEDGVGPLLRRRYRAVIGAPRMSAEDLMTEVSADPNVVVPGALAHFAKVHGEEGVLRVGDEFTVRMPGPWDGPIRVVEVTPTSFRFVTLQGHIEAGQIEWRARAEGDRVAFEIESWSRAGDRLSFVMHHRLRMAKEVQLHMWMSVLERVLRRYGGRRDAALDIETRSVETG